MNKNISKEELKRYNELCIMALDFARHGQTEQLKAMLDAKLPVNLQDSKGNSLLMLASYNGNEETTQLLIDYHAKVDMKNDKGQTPLAGVCFKGNLQIVKMLVDAGANINENNGIGTTPLMFTSMFGHIEIVEFLSTYSSGSKIKAFIIFAKMLDFVKRRL